MLTVYLIGVPGAGKTTVMRTLTRHCARRPQAGPPPHDRLLDGGRIVAVELGRHRTGHAGTDGLSYSVVPQAVTWIERGPHPLVLAEGDRLACDRFLDAAARVGDLLLVLLDTPEVVAAERRAAQPRRKAQDPTWLAGRATKVRRLAEQRHAVRLDGSRTPGWTVGQLLDLDDRLDALVPRRPRAITP